MFRVIRVEKAFCQWLVDKGKQIGLTNGIIIYDLVLEGLLQQGFQLYGPIEMYTNTQLILIEFGV